MKIDTKSEFGARAARRLKDELIYWLVTVGSRWHAPAEPGVGALGRGDVPDLQPAGHARSSGTSQPAPRWRSISTATGRAATS